MSLGFEKTAVTEVDGDWTAAEQFNLALEQLANRRRAHSGRRPICALKDCF